MLLNMVIYVQSFILSILRYFELVEICREINQDNESKNNKRNVSVIQDVDGDNIVVINDIVFKGHHAGISEDETNLFMMIFNS